MTKPLVVWAHQAPTLLNVLAQSDKWRLETTDLGDSGGLAESRLLDVPTYQGGRPRIVFVCSPDQFGRATHYFNYCRIIWVLHNGKRDLIPSDMEHYVTEALTFSHHVAELQDRDRVLTHVIVPAYRPNLQYRWSPNKLWAMINRPKTRSGEHERDVLAVQRLSGKPMTVFGQDQKAGFIDDKSAVYGDCSGYVSALPDWAGFGLSEHECFAAGVPVIGNVGWGDMRQEMPDYEGLRGTVEEQAEAASRVATDSDFAASLSRRGIEFIEQYRSQERMDEDIESILDLRR